MSVPDEIDDLIGVLRSPASASELADENRTVAAMARAFQSSEGKTNMHSTSRRVRIGVLIATGIIGFGGVAAAGPGGVFDDEVVEEPTMTTEAVDASTIPAEVTTTEADPLPPAATATVATPEEARTASIEVLAVEGDPIPLVDDTSTTFDETQCLDGNHGKTVSAVARGDLVPTGTTGLDVRDAAHSSCGKQDAAAESIEPEEETDSVETSDSVETDPAKEKKSGHSNGNGRGQSNGQGHGNGKGD